MTTQRGAAEPAVVERRDDFAIFPEHAEVDFDREAAEPFDLNDCTGNRLGPRPHPNRTKSYRDIGRAGIAAR